MSAGSTPLGCASLVDTAAATTEPLGAPDQTIPSVAGPLVALLAIALIFRPQVIAIGPLLPSIQAGLGMSHGLAGALSAIPVLCMGIFAPLGPRLARRLGARWALAACAVLVIVFGLVRLVVPGPMLVLLLTFGVGLGMGLAGPIFPLIVRTRLPARPALGTGAYASGLVLGGTLAAALAIPLAGASGDWRFSLAAVTLAGIGSLAIWLVLAPADAVLDSSVVPSRIPWRSPIGWVLGLVFGLQSTLFYGVVAWLAAVYIDRGWSGPAAAQLVAVFSAVTLAGTVLTPLVADRIGTRRAQLVVSSVAVLVGTLGVVLVPDAALVWAVLLGAGMGAIFPIVLTLPVDVGGRPTEVAATAAVMLLVGYLFASVGPFVFGVARDVSGDFALSLWLLVAAAAFLLALCALMTPDRLRRIGAHAATTAGDRPTRPA
ncbi:MAG TPA: MFS transporter [Candidatus Limnocylindrales bacterium]